ncbi:DUF4221 family protein [Thermoflexibacter ruber]|uniref:DUF4221 family protein n=1 Tax=Thermoflexibacter ruber TaxID=1003 RepID=UPI001C883E1B|nr:DUF4221 family protein [Thermoflexibacter ruber]
MLDSVTAPHSTCIQYLENFFLAEKQADFLATLNMNDNSIIFYDYEIGSMKSKIKFFKEGEQGVGSIFGFSIINQDSILIHRYHGMQLYLVNSKAQVLKSYKLSSDNFPFSVFPASTSNPINKIHNYVYMNSDGKLDPNNAKVDLKGIVACIDINTGKIVPKLYYPEIYKIGIWTPEFLTSYHTPPLFKEQVVFSFPIIDSIYVTDYNDYVGKYYAGSKFQNSPIKPLSTQLGSGLPPYEQREKYRLSQLYYGAIYYDEFQKYYYRFCFLPISESDYVSGVPLKSKEQKVSIIILDSSFNKVGEVDLEAYKYNPYMVFINKNGLHIALKANGNEDNLIFEIFKVVKK